MDHETEVVIAFSETEAVTRIVPTRRASVIVGFLAGFMLSAPVGAAPPAEPLLNHIPADAGFCVIVQNLREHSQNLSQSPFAEWFESSPLSGRIIPEADRGKLRAFETILKTQFDLTFEQIRNEILGDAVVFAYRPGPPEQPADEWGLFLIRPRKPILVERFFDRLNELQLRSGEITGARSETYRNQKYTIREKTNGSEYYLVHNGMVAFSGQELAIRAWIDHLEEPPSGPSFFTANLARMNAADALVALVIQPRNFDRHLATRIEAVLDPREQAFLRQFSKIWSACDGLAVTVSASSTFDIELLAAFRREQMPEELHPFLLAEPVISQFWSSIPDSALFALAGRTDPLEIFSALDSFTPEGHPGIQTLAEHGLRPVLGRDRFVSVLRSFGPDWAVWIDAPAQKSDGLLPGGTAVIRLGGDETTRTAIEQGVELLLQLGRIAYNQAHVDQIDLHYQRSGSRMIRYLSNDDRFPEGFRPAFTRDGDVLIIASSPARIERFEPARKTVSEQRSAPVPVLRIPVVQLRAYLEGQREALTAFLAQNSGKSPDSVARELEQFSLALSPFDRLEVKRSAESVEGRTVTRLTLQITMVKPLANQ